jgi:hypothetical protein
MTDDGGYPVVLDVRLDKPGEALIAGKSGPHTVIEVLIDVTPRVTRRKA